MALQWVFEPNAYANVWLAPSDPVTDPPDYAGIDCQQLKPWYNARPLSGPFLVHRCIFRLTDIGNITSTQLNSGMWIILVDSLGNPQGWFRMTDPSPFAYINGGGFPQWDYILYAGYVVNF